MRFKGRLVKDAAKPFKVSVRQNDIDKASPRDPTCCAIAQGLKRHKGVGEVYVGGQYVYIERGAGKPEPTNHFERFELKPKDRKKVKTFDYIGFFQTDTFELDTPKIKTGDRVGTKPGSNVREGKARNIHRSPALRHI